MGQSPRGASALIREPRGGPEEMREAAQATLIDAAVGDGYVPWQVHWDLTYACQLKCAHCYQMNLDWNRKGELSTDRILETLDELRGLGTQELTFSGGDPF